MSSPLELRIRFSHLDTNYDIRLQRAKPSEHSIKMNGLNYTVLGDQDKVEAACKILNSLTLNDISNVNDLKGRLSQLKDISFPTQNAHEVAKKTLGKSSFRNRNTAQLSLMVKHISSESDLRALCRECLAQNNNHPKLALVALKRAYLDAGAGTPSVKITEMLQKEASDRNVDEIRAFGRGRTVKVAKFIKSLPQTANGAIDLTQMKKIGQGGTQDVYMLEKGSQKYVIKVNKASLKMKTHERGEKYTFYNSAYQTLQRAFGEHCTVEQLLLREVADATGVKKAIISVADFEPGFKNKSKVGLRDKVFRWNDVAIVKHQEQYVDMLKSVLFFDDAPAFNLSAWEAFNPKIAMIAKLIREDPEFAQAMRKFIKLFTEYFKQTGQYLDIAGKDNIIFFKNDQGWTFKLGTVIKSETAEKFLEGMNWLHNGAEETKGSEDHSWIMKYCFHWGKTLNTLAKLVGMDKAISEPMIEQIWDDLVKDGITGIPADPKRFSAILQVVETHSAEELVEQLDVLGIDLDKEAETLVSIIEESPADKKMAIAHYLHDRLPLAPDDPSDDLPNAYNSCPIRFYTANAIRKLPEGKALALECYREVLKDPRGPREDVEEYIQEMNIYFI